jgi:D-beta-D-heptose 7-phosphate kinase/D-beta-D-heptose 1-phosphate adenosyltransferase
VEYLLAARKMGDVLVVGLNTDASIRRIKGDPRPINKGRDRAAVLSALGCVDYVCFFGDDTPFLLITAVVPDVLVKGADWPVGAIVGKDVVEKHGGVVRTVRLTPGRSTTGVIEKILAAYRGRNSTRHNVQTNRKP